MTLLAELNLKEASWQHKFIFVPRALFDIDKSNFMSILEELPNQDKSTDSQQAESSTVAGIYIRDSKGKEYDTIHLVFDHYNLTSSLKEATPERRQDGRDVNKDLTPKDQDKDNDLTPKDQYKDKDLKYVLKESLRTRTRTRTTTRQNNTNCT